MKNLTNENNFNLEDIIIIWLEDDWKLNDDNLDIEYIIENYLFLLDKYVIITLAIIGAFLVFSCSLNFF